jgi:uncharacterized protein (TIGR04255 family)
MELQTPQMPTSYKRPPITEAVIEFRFAQPLALPDMEKARHDFAREFPAVSRLENFEVQVTDQPVSPSVKLTAGYRMHSNDGTEIISITVFAVSFSRLAPYNGWEAFSESALGVYKRFRSLVGYTQIGRIGVRYVNRLDIPVANPNVPVRLEHYITIQPEYPENGLPALQTFAVQGVFKIESGYLVTINVASVPPPLPRFMSILLDIDLGAADNVPQKTDDMRDLINTMRDEKNRIFELCITDETRETFNQ